ncbi:MAG: hypothetical protein DWQ41_13225 [Planctomycetota bacterium]|nr:MAG: hypothetical protein DWQ41_13225 [Planctomycetota bacterium]
MRRIKKQRFRRRKAAKRRGYNSYERRDGTLRTWFSITSYPEYLQSELWKTIRGKVFATKGVTCHCCRKRRATSVHHQEYDYKTLAGESLDHLYPICESCHKRIERNSDGSKVKNFETVQRRFLKLCIRNNSGRDD